MTPRQLGGRGSRPGPVGLPGSRGLDGLPAVVAFGGGHGLSASLSGGGAGDSLERR